MQLTGSPSKLFIPFQFMEAVRLRLREFGKYFTTDPVTLERLRDKFGDDFEGAEEGMDYKAWGAAFKSKMAMLSRGTLWEILVEVMGEDAQVRIDAYGGKRTLGKGALTILPPAHAQGGMIIDVGFHFSYGTALKEAGKDRCVGVDRTPLRPLITKVRGGWGIRSAIKERNVYLSGGSYTGGNVVVKFLNSAVGKEWGDRALTTLGFNMEGRDDLRVREIKFYDARIGHGGRTDDGPLRKLLRGKVRCGAGRVG